MPSYDYYPVCPSCRCVGYQVHFWWCRYSSYQQAKDDAIVKRMKNVSDSSSPTK